MTVTAPVTTGSDDPEEFLATTVNTTEWPTTSSSTSTGLVSPTAPVVLPKSVRSSAVTSYWVGSGSLALAALDSKASDATPPGLIVTTGAEGVSGVRVGITQSVAVTIESPIALVATTSKVYIRPGVRPVTLIGLESPLADGPSTSGLETSWATTLYLVIGEPLSRERAKLIVAERSPASTNDTATAAGTPSGR